MYVTKPEMTAAILEARQGRKDKLVDVIFNMTNGILRKYHNCQSTNELREHQEEMRGRVWILIEKKLHLFDTSKNCFSYITTVILNEYRLMIRTDKRHANTIERMKERLMQGG